MAARCAPSSTSWTRTTRRRRHRRPNRVAPAHLHRLQRVSRLNRVRRARPVQHPATCRHRRVQSHRAAAVPILDHLGCLRQARRRLKNRRHLIPAVRVLRHFLRHHRRRATSHPSRIPKSRIPRNLTPTSPTLKNLSPRSPTPTHRFPKSRCHQNLRSRMRASCHKHFI